MKIALLLTVFWTMQAAAQAAFTLGSCSTGRWLAGFIIGNALGVTSMIVLMQLYAGGNPGLAFAIGVGGAFVAAQCTIALVMRQPPGLGQWACVVLIAAGMMGYALLGKPAQPAVTTAVPSLSHNPPVPQPGLSQ